MQIYIISPLWKHKSRDLLQALYSCSENRNSNSGYSHKAKMQRNQFKAGPGLMEQGPSSGKANKSDSCIVTSSAVLNLCP